MILYPVRSISSLFLDTELYDRPSSWYGTLKLYPQMEKERIIECALTVKLLLGAIIRKR